MQGQSTLRQLKAQKLQGLLARFPLQGLVQNLPGFVLLRHPLQVLNLLLPFLVLCLLFLQRLKLLFLRTQRRLKALLLLLNLPCMRGCPLHSSPGQQHPNHPTRQGCGPAMTPSALTVQRRVME